MKNAAGRSMDCGMLINMIADQIENEANRMLNRREITLSQLRYLEYLKAAAPKPVYFKDLEKYFQASQPTVSGMMRRLEEKGLIRVTEAGYGRAKTAAITQAGTAITVESEAFRDQEEENLLAGLDEDERKEFRDMLARIHRHLSEKNRG